jgi:hypothetical protein
VSGPAPPPRGPGRAGIPRTLFGPTAAVTDPDEHDVTPADPDALVPLGRGQIRLGHVVARLEPGHPARSRHIEQHPAADDAVGGDRDGQLGRSGLGDGFRRHSVVQLTIEDDVAQGIDVSVGVAVDVHRDPVHAERQPRPCVGPQRLLHLVLGGVGVVERLPVLHRRGQ